MSFSDYCVDQNCNFGVCIGRFLGFDCQCDPGYEGELCETEIDECKSNPCLNDGLCIDLLNDFECECQPAYNGSYCEVDICDSDPCNTISEQSICRNLGSHFECDCEAGFEGDLCETDINECSLNSFSILSSCINSLAVLTKTNQDFF